MGQLQIQELQEDWEDWEDWEEYRVLQTHAPLPVVQLSLISVAIHQNVNFFTFAQSMTFIEESCVYYNMGFHLV